MTGTTSPCWKKGGSRMIVASFVGSNREFRAYLAARMVNVVSLAEYREKRKAVSRRAAFIKPSNPIIA
jgi:hypothetical protein